MAKVIELRICMGSACHQRGVSEVLPVIQRLIQGHDLEGRVVLKGAFCLGPCTEGIVMQLGDRPFTRINPANVAARFEEDLLPAIRSALDEP